MKKFLLKAFMLLCLILWGGVSSAWAEEVQIYHNEGTTETSNGITVSGNVNTTASNGNPGNSFANTSSSNTTFTFSGFDVSSYSDLKLNLDVKFTYPSTVTTYPSVTVEAYKNDVKVFTDNSTITVDEKVNGYQSYTVNITADFDKIVLTCVPGTGKSKNGNATTTYGTYMDNIEITGVASTGGVVNVAGVTLDKTSLDLTVGKTATLSATISPSNATDKNVSWSSDDESVATVADGVVTAVAEGNATITVTTKDGSYVATCDVTVSPFVQTYANTYTSGDDLLTTTGGTSASTAKISWDGNEYDAIKAGTSSTAGVVKVTVPANTKTLHLHIAGWKDEGKAITVSGLAEAKDITINPDAGLTSNSPFTLQNDPETNHYYTIDTNNDEALTLTLTAKTGKRFAIFGVNAEEKEANPTTAIITLNAACHDTDGMVYGTYSNSSAFIANGDIVVYEIMEDGGQIALEAYATDAVVPANTGVLVAAFEGGDYEVQLTNQAGTSVLGEYNALRATGNGITAEQMADADAGKEYFRLTMHNATDCGFWWGAENGAAFALGANKAYLVADPAAGGARGFSFSDNSEALESIEMNAATTIYTLEGVKVNELQKGLNIVNGKKVMVK